MSVTKFDRTNLKQIRTDLEAALDNLSKKHQISLTVGNISFNDMSFSTKIKAAITDGDNSIDKIEWATHAWRFGLEEDDFGKTFTHNGKLYITVGIKPRSSKYPLVAQRVGTTDQYKMTVEAFKNGKK